MSTTQTRERPVNLYPHEVRGILSGRQSQLRRVVKPQPHFSEAHNSWMWPRGRGTSDMNWRARETTNTVTGHVTHEEYALPVEKWLLESDRCPFIVGQQLWVKEKWAWSGDVSVPESERTARGEVWYRADAKWEKHGSGWHPSNVRWRSSIHMPRWASRLTLEIESVKVERLQSISEADAKAEGATPRCESISYSSGERVVTHQHGFRDGFRSLWVEIHGEDSWDRNEWVWAIAFKVVEAPR